MDQNLLARRVQEEEVQRFDPEQFGFGSFFRGRNTHTTMLRGLLEVQTNSPGAFVLLYLIYGLLEMIATTIFVCLYHELNCTKNLQLWISIFSSRFFFVIPFHIYKHRVLQRGNETPARVIQYLQILNIISFIWFITGQVWLYESTCRGPLFIYCLTVVALVYAAILFPITFLVGALVCLIIGLVLFAVFGAVVVAINLGLCLCFPIFMPFIRRYQQQRYGASQVDLSQLDTTTFNSQDQEEYPDLTCSVCLNDFTEGETVTTLPCQHHFHKNCIESWLHIKRICPLCRHDIREPMERQYEEVEVHEINRDPLEQEEDLRIDVQEL